MDNTEKYPKRPNPVQNANFLSELTFTYMLPIFKKAYKEKLTEDDLFSPLASHDSSILGNKLERIWKEEYRKHKKSALHRALLRMFGLRFLMVGLLQLFNEILFVTVIPISIGKLVRFFETGQTQVSEAEAYYYCGAIIATLFVDVFTIHPRIMCLQHLTMKIRVACSALLYRKTLRLSRTALGKTTVGQMVNLLSNDLSRFDQGFVLVHFVWVGPIQVAVGTWLLYREIDYAALFGILFLISFVPLQGYLGKRTSVLRLRTAVRTDERVRLMNEVVSGIQVIKMYCWEKPFAKLVALARRREMQAIRGKAYITGLIYSFEMFVSRTSIFISILGYVLLGNLVTAEKVFSVTAIYNVLRPVITVLFSLSITSIAEANVSVLRVQKFLSYEEIQSPKGQDEAPHKESHSENSLLYPSNGSLKEKIAKNGFHKEIHRKIKLKLHNVYAKWTEEFPDDILENISLNVNEKQLLAVIGPVGSGKSSLINVVLGELSIRSGYLEIEGKLAYASQEPWLFSGSVRQNILFGEEYDDERYEKVVQVCALKTDFALLPYGDRTLVGEKGKSLSGGQRARINLARCIYKKADIYLLDDPLSAVDANVGKHLYEVCIRDFLKDKIRILVTHQLQHLQSADKIIIMNEGQIQVQGNYKELKSSGVNFSKLLEEFNTEEEEEEKRKVRSRQNSEIKEEFFDQEDEDEPEVEKETQGIGSVGISTYWKYFRAGGNICTITILALSFLSCQVAASAAEYFVTYWVNLEQDFSDKVSANRTAPNETINREEIVYIYSGLTIATIVVSLFKSLFFMVFFTVASRNLHDFIFSKIIQAKMNFYNLNPSGRILNRFSKDIGNVDEYIPSVLIDVIEIALLLAGTIVLSSIVEPFLLIPAIGLMILFYVLRCIYVETSRSVKRIEATAKSPVFSHMSASVDGLSTIRAFSAQDLLIHEFDELQNRHNAAWFLFIGSSRCFAFWLDLICVIFIAFATFSLISMNKVLYGGDVGLVITQYIGLMGSLQWGMRQWAELENQMTSVERVFEYTKLESEPKRKELISIPTIWPQRGEVRFKDVNLRYGQNDPYVLKNLTFTVEPKQKVGIVGRTGAGKSSTISALFQLYDLEGKIIIDDLDTTELPLEKVRSKISIIPQEPVLFSGQLEELAPMKAYKPAAACNKCNKYFSNYSNLKHHVKTFYPDEVNDLVNDKYYLYKCDECPKQFSGQKNFQNHKKTHEAATLLCRSNSFKCPLCSYEDVLKSKLISHFEQVHNIFIVSEDKKFNSLEEFMFWKTQEEKTTRSSFISKHGSKNTINYIKMIYVCHRSDKFIPKGSGMRHLKCQGSNKMGAFCPATITVTIKDGYYYTNYIKTHVGHDNDLGHLFLTQYEKQKLASKIAAKIPLSAILDEIRDSITNTNFDRIHLLTKKDLYNIEQTYNLNSISVRHKNDAISIEAWINGLQNSNCVLFYKPQDELSQEYPLLEKEDFVLILMTDGQKEMLTNFGNDCVCTDGTHGLNSYGFELITLLVLDEVREGFPCTFMISNRSDEEAIYIFFCCIEKSLGSKISPKVFMSDMAESFFNAWLRVMNPPQYRLFCSWHVDRAWRKNLNKINSKELQVVTYKQLRTLLQETDVAAFSLMLEAFLKTLFENEHTLEFGCYFRTNYVGKVEAWAYCYRLHSGLNTNMHVERMHYTIKYMYLNGKYNKRLDKAINAILKFVRDKLFDRLITIQKGKLCSKLKELRSRHKTSQQLDPNLVVPMEKGWQVTSSSSQEIYLVEERKLQCICKLLCSECDTCLHKYSCTCLDSSIRYNMCKHIHLICRYQKQELALKHANNNFSGQVDSVQDHSKNNLVIDEEKSKTNSQVADLVNILGSDNNMNNTNTSLEKEKERLKSWFCSKVDEISSEKELTAIKKIVAPIEPTLKAINNEANSIVTPQENKFIPHNKNIPKQRRLFSTKKKNKTSKNKRLKKPSVEDVHMTAVQLLHLNK